MLHKVILLTGSNENDRIHFLQQAYALLEEEAGKIMDASSIYESSPWGNTDQPFFLNQVIILQTALAPHALLQKILDIEKRMGRSRNGKWQQRKIDIDILFYAEEVIRDEELVVPHPHIQDRMFTLLPLAEIQPGFMHPVLKKTITRLLELCTDKGTVQRIPYPVHL